MSSSLARVRDRFEATPRSLDDEQLTRIARGDRGCLGDVLSGLGALSLVTAVILGAMETISYSWTYVGAGLWIAGFVWGTVSQSRSGARRKQALESGPLVVAVVVRSEAWLRRPGKRVGRAVVVFTTADEHRFDRDWIERAAQSIEASLEAKAGAASWVPLRALLVDQDAFGLHRVPAELLPEPAANADAPVYLATMHVDPERLEHGYLGGDDDHEAGELDVDLDAPRRAPHVVAIVDPEHEFIEHAPL
ncbi:hypothetical protein DB30_06626 [Enhygromyxa salina]|uniref:Uncharacterized protein n=1 Tax=Enhygromyxa salina TaxID=215803 RepID=A0A0C2CTU1_9BACT|nr:hypothetical protein [Enhygromyxa salina]KIG14571.1 hypothetical protein DB30_06626 [Enhygromyxa salina]